MKTGRGDIDNTIWILPTILVFIVLFMIGRCTPRINERYIIGSVKRENLELYEEMKGKAEARNPVFIGVDVGMGIDDVYFKAGERIKKGDIIIRFSDYKLEALERNIDEKKTALAWKRSQLRLLKEENNQGINNIQEIQRLETEINALSKETKGLTDEKKLIRRVIISPIDGYVLKINAIKGKTVETGEPAVILAGKHDMKIVSDPVKLSRPEYVTIGNKAEIKKSDAVLYKMNNIGIGELKKLEFLMKSPSDIILDEEMSIRLYYYRKENVLTVPLSAVVSKKDGNGGKFFIYLVDKDNKVTEKEVFIGAGNSEKIEIKGKNIKEGMEIVAFPDGKIRNNVIVGRRSLSEEKAEREEKIRKLNQENERKLVEIEKNERNIIRLKRGGDK